MESEKKFKISGWKSAFFMMLFIAALVLIFINAAVTRYILNANADFLAVFSAIIFVVVAFLSYQTFSGKAFHYAVDDVGIHTDSLSRWMYYKQIVRLRGFDALSINAQDVISSLISPIKYETISEIEISDAAKLLGKSSSMYADSADIYINLTGSGGSRKNLLGISGKIAIAEKETNLHYVLAPENPKEMADAIKSRLASRTTKKKEG